jgi:Antitoxin VbhA
MSKRTISPEEMQRRRAHVRTAIADSRIEGLPPPTSAVLEIFEAYIHGEIEAADLVTAYLARMGQYPREIPRPVKGACKIQSSI